jgi:hypothetical protein
LRGDPIGVSAALSSSDSERPVVRETASKNSSAIRRALLPVQIHFPIDHVRLLGTLAQAALLKKLGKSDVTTSSRKSTIGMAADFAGNRPIVGTEFGTMVGTAETAPDAPASRLKCAGETTQWILSLFFEARCSIQLSYSAPRNTSLSTVYGKFFFDFNLDFFILSTCEKLQRPLSIPYDNLNKLTA